MENIEEKVLNQTLGLAEYEANALDGLLRLGRTTAPNLAEATGIPNARIYGILEDLGNAGYIKIIPGRPKEYEPKSPSKILSQAEENRRQAYETFCADVEGVRDEFLGYYRPLYQKADDQVSSSEELFYVVDVGEPSERQTRKTYREAETEICVMTQSFEYLDSVEPALRDTVDRGVQIQILFTHPDRLSTENLNIQQMVRERIETNLPNVEYRFNNLPMTWRGTIADPEEESGTAILLVGEKDTPLHMRQAAVTEDESFVVGMKQYFQLLWEHESSMSLEQE